MHSNVIYSLINPDGLHYQGDLFLKLFIKYVLKIPDFGNVYEVQAEEQTDKNRRIDFTIKSDKYFIGIEMKVDSGDLKKQIYDYYHYLNQESINSNGQKVLIYYLTKHKQEASLYSLCDEELKNPISDVKNITFDKEILKWIDKSQNEVQNITNLNEAFENYKTIVQKITKNYNSKVLNMKNFLYEDDNMKFLGEIFEMKNNIHKILGSMLFKLFINIDEFVEQKIEKEKLFNKIENLYDEPKCINWFYNDEKMIKGLQKTECIGSFYELTNNILLRVEVATHHFHIGLISYTKSSDGKYEIVTPNDELIMLAQQYSELKYRDWRWAKWYSIDCGNFISLNDKTKKCYENFDTCFLKEKIITLINFVNEQK